MKIEKITLYHIKLKLKQPFETSFGRIETKETLLVKIESQGFIGWGESAHLTLPLYTSEYLEGGKTLLVKHILSNILGKDFKTPKDLINTYSFLKGNNISKAGVEMALWDLLARKKGLPLYKMLGSNNHSCEIGVSIGIEKDTKIIIEKIKKYLLEGYKRIKIKIKPGQDIEVVKKIREVFPDISLMVDANSAYSLDQIDIFKKLDKYNLLMIEQPLADDDIIDHAKLQKIINTPICLDESIHSFEDARKAIELGSCKIINIKPARVGGINETIKIHDFCQKRGIPVWVGGMLESGIGKSFLDHIATMSNFTLPGDNSDSSRYFEEDIVENSRLQDKGVINISDNPGIGLEPNQELLNKHTVDKIIFDI